MDNRTFNWKEVHKALEETKQRIKKRQISKSEVEDILAILSWVSRDTLDCDRLLTEDELLEPAKKIMDYCLVDYYTKAGY